MTSKDQQAGCEKNATLEEKRARLAEALRRKTKSPTKAPLSFGQQRLWFVDQLDPGSPLYNITFSFRVLGGVNLKFLQEVIEAIAERHEPLRTTFGLVDGEPVQLISRPVKGGELKVTEFGDTPGDGRDDKIERFVRKQNNVQFDLQKGPLYLLTLLRISADEYIGCCTLHHIISDGWSVGVVLLELAAAYSQLAQGEPISLPKLPIRYRDYVKWQQEKLQGKELARLLEHWTDRLQGANQFLNLPTDHPRPDKLTHTGTVYRFHLSSELLGSLTALGQRHGTTLFATLLTGYASLLYRYTGQSDMIIGVPIAGRDRPEIQPLVGYFVNVLPERIQIRDEIRFSELLDEVRKSTTESFANQDVPFEKLVEALQPQRTQDRNPLIQVVYLYQNFPMPDQYESYGFGVELIEIHPGFSRFELGLRTEQAEHGIDCLIEYNTDLFDESTIERFSIHFRNLLKSVIADSNQCVANIPILSKSEHQLLVKSFNEFNDSTEKRIGDATVDEAFEFRARQSRSKVAVSSPGCAAVTFGELSDSSNQFAARLQAIGLQPQQTVAVICEPSAQMIIALLGILKAGGAFLLLDPTSPSEWSQRQIEGASISCFAVSQTISKANEALLSALTSNGADCQMLLINGLEKDTEQQSDPSQLSPRSVEPDDVACTSFSTIGQHRGVEIEHRNLVASIQSAIDAFQVTDGDKFGVYYRPTNFASVVALLAPLLAGAQLDILNAEWETTTGNHDLLHIAPTDLKELADRSSSGQVRFVGLPDRVLILSGEVISWSLIERLRRQSPQLLVESEFGFAETSGNGLRFKIASEDERAARSFLQVPLGGPNVNVSAFVLDQAGTPVPFGVAGELCLEGASVARCYLGAPAQTKGGFTQNPLRSAGQDRFFRTGEAVRIRPNGNIEHLGRCDDRVRLTCGVVEPREIESMLRQYPAVAQCLVVATTHDFDDFIDEPECHDSGHRHLVAYIVPGEEGAPTDKQLRKFLATRIPRYMVPRAFELLEELPLSSDGSYDLDALPQPRKAKTAIRKTPAKTETEKQLAAVWQQVLGLEEVGIHDDFFALGGNSLLAMQLVQAVRKQFDAQLPLGLIFENPTIANIAYLFDRAAAGADDLQQVTIAPAPEGQTLPLSHSQYVLWLVEQFEQGIAFNAPLGFRLDGPLDVDCLVKTLNEISRRHAILRASIQIENGQPFHSINQSSEVSFEYKDLTQLPQEQREPESINLAKLLTHQPFDLAKGNLVRYLLVKMEPEQHLLLVAIHHIVSDGWSFAVMMQEMVQLYQAFVDGQPSPLPELAIQFTDYAHWQRNTISEQAKIQSQYWLETLGTTPPVLDLPTDFARSKSIAVEPDVCDLLIPGDLVAALSEIGSQEGSTLYMTILTAYMIFLQRHANQDDFIVGSAIANRPHPQTHDLIGFFASLLPIRGDLAGEPTFLELLDQVRRKSGEAIARPEPDMEQLVPLMQQPGLGRMPLCQVLFTFAEFPDEPIVAGGVNWIPQELNIVRVSGFDLVLALSRDGKDLKGALLYRPDLFRFKTVERWKESFIELLKGIIRNPAARISQFPVITEPQRECMLEQWNETNASFPQNVCVHDLFEKQAEKTPNAIAVIDPDAETSYRKLDQTANRLAVRLQALSIKNDDLVAVLVPRSADMIAALLGIMKAGAAYLPLDPGWPIGRMANILKNARCKAIVTAQSQLAHIAEIRQQLKTALPVVDVQPSPSENLDGVDTFCKTSVSANDLAYVIYTSGSTGPPKGVMVEHESVVNVIHSFATTYQLRAGDRVLQQSSVAFDVSVNEIFPVLTAGGTLVIPPPDCAADFDAIAELVEQCKITIMAATPSGLTELNRRSEKFRSVRLVLSGGEALAESHVDQMVKFATVTNGYGPTETTVCATFFDLNSIEQNDARTIPIGKPLPNYRVYIVDHELNLVPIGCPGELCIAGVGLARGYLGDPELTASKFVDNPFEPGQRLYLTGDEARWLSDGNIEFLGRIDRQVKIRGFRVELGEIETALEQRTEISQVVVICDDDSLGNQRIVSYIASVDPVSEAEQYSAELREFLLESLPAHMVPAVFMFLEELPLTSNGKVDLQSLPKPIARRPHLDVPFVAPRNNAEETMAEIWRDALSLDRIGMDDNFFALGGHSLLAAQIMHRVQQQFEIVLPYRLFFESQTVAKTAELVEQIRQHGIESLTSDPSTEVSQVDSSVASPDGQQTRQATPDRVDAIEGLTQQVDRNLAKLKAEAKAYFKADATARDKWTFSPELNSILSKQGREVRDEVWQAFVESHSKSRLRGDYDTNKVRFENHESPYTVKQVGTRPDSGWPLFIALHGGGGTTQQVNDHQWKVMQSYYRDQPNLGGYQYLALRAPNDEWNGFYDDFVYPLVENLIRQFALFGDIDTNKVFLIGYSHGGYGAFAIGPKLPHRFAAIHSSAAAPVDGETAAETLRTTRFTYMIGENENTSTLRRCDRFAEQIEQLRIQNPDQYPVQMLIKPRHGHTGLPDRDMIGEMYSFSRQPTPKHVTWRMTDSIVKDFFWITADRPGKQKKIDAQLVDNRLLIESEDVDRITIWLNEEMIDFEKPLRIFVNEAEQEPKLVQPSVKTLCDSLLRNGDRRLAFEAQIEMVLSSADNRLIQATACEDNPES